MHRGSWTVGRSRGGRDKCKPNTVYESHNPHVVSPGTAVLEKNFVGKGVQEKKIDFEKCNRRGKKARIFGTVAGHREISSTTPADSSLVLNRNCLPCQSSSLPPSTLYPPRQNACRLFPSSFFFFLRDGIVAPACDE